MATTRAVISDEDLFRLPKDGCKYEVVAGELRQMSPAGWLHERIVMALGIELGPFVHERGLGDVLGSNALYRLPGGNRRGPDLSFVAAGRLPAPGDGSGVLELAPDLAVEVLSPSDRRRQVLDKVGEYLDAGVRLVWVIDPKARTASVHRSLTQVRQIPEEGALDGEDVVPGFSCPLARIFGKR
jgi:Uma2 family endonuclease